MSNLRTKGFKWITFWREDSVGVIVIKATSDGMIADEALPELFVALTTAATDDQVKSVALTGQNMTFLKGIIYDKSSVIEMLDSARALVSVAVTIEKPIYSVVNGTCTDFGYELALLGDCIIAHGGCDIGFSRDYRFIMAGSVTSRRFSPFKVEKAEAGKNVDFVVPADNLLGDSKTMIETLNMLSRANNRRIIMAADVRNALLAEHYDLMKREFRSMLNSDQEEVSVKMGGS
ncbi:MAG TPA: enoyl-CoA hydratase-related protein [Thermoplasmataceae archaeon]|nr:hypothetical protein [Thermoplasmatales archaeon AK]HLH85730.1 enoyl-CoA hydratase-related protein [Thermoplasmataceae archaeon]